MNSKSILETINPKGHLEIIKVYNDGTTELVLDDHNIITDGMGSTLASLFASEDTTTSFDNYTLAYFQIGETSGTMNSTRTALVNPLEEAQYGNTSLTVSSHLDSAGTTLDFVHINPSQVSKITNTKVTYSLVLDEDTANGLDLEEIGLFSKNPTLSTPSKSFLCAYRSFSAVSKNDSFALVLKWTIEF